MVRCVGLPQINNNTIGASPIAIDLDGDGVVEIIATNVIGELFAIDGATCATKWTNLLADVGYGFGLAAADLDGDGHPEIAAASSDAAEVRIFDHTGQQIAAGPYDKSVYGYAAIADIDGVAPPEIAIGGTVYRYVPGNPALQVLYSHPAGPSDGYAPTFADVDGDGAIDLIAGFNVFDGATGIAKTPSNLFGGPFAWPAIADFNGDGHPDLASLEFIKHRVSIFDLHANAYLLPPTAYASDDSDGATVVSDFDGDGLADVGFAATGAYNVFSARGLLWSKPLPQDSSGGSPSTVFDFNGDGIPEVIYRDECWLRFLNGRDGETLFATSMSGITISEGPLVVDVDGDGHADVIVPTGDPAFDCSGYQADTGQVWHNRPRGLYVLTGANNQWVSTRRIWNAFDYHVTNVADDGSIPKSEQSSWLANDTFRANLQGSASPLPTGGLPDFTAGPAITPAMIPDGIDGIPLVGRICNRGATVAAAGVAGTFYRGPRLPDRSNRICTVYTSGALGPGKCETVWCPGADCDPGTTRVLHANDHGNQMNERSECDPGNNEWILTCPMPD